MLALLADMLAIKMELETLFPLAGYTSNIPFRAVIKV